MPSTTIAKMQQTEANKIILPLVVLFRFTVSSFTELFKLKAAIHFS